MQINLKIKMLLFCSLNLVIVYYSTIVFIILSSVNVALIFINI
jgi:hypothetical protein